MTTQTSMFDDDPFGGVKHEAASSKGLSPRQVNEIHTKADKDVGPNALHHTLGTDRNQAASGSHVHGGKDSKKIGDGMGLNVTGSRASGAAFQSLMTELGKVMAITNNSTP